MAEHECVGRGGEGDGSVGIFFDEDADRHVAKWQLRRTHEGAIKACPDLD